MSENVKARLRHALLSVLAAAGLVFPLLGILLPSLVSPLVLLPLLLTVLLFELASVNRVSAILVSSAAVLALLVWLFALDGLVLVTDVARAVSLRFAGVDAAVPLVSSPLMVLLTVLVTLLSCLSCLRSASCLPLALLCVAVVLLLYLTDSASLIPWFLPALAALLLMAVLDRFRETPLLPLLPWVAVLVAAAFLIAGRGTGDTPLKQKADELRQAVLDRLFFTEPRDVFSISSEGWYPEGLAQLGGKPEPNEQPVMQVSTPRTVYLRGSVFNQYTGRNWVNTAGGRRYLWQSALRAAEKDSLFDLSLPPASVQNTLCAPSVVSVRMLRNSASTLFVPQRVRELTPGGELVPYFSNSSELFITRNLEPGDTYSVSAPLFQAGDPGIGTLIAACSTLEDSRYEQVFDRYTVLPAHLEEPVYQLAREASAVAEAPYEKALALQSWLSRNFRYTLDVSDQPGDIDFVTHFLLDTKEGYCTYFASAMTVLCRMAGLPARYVEGYVAEPDEHGEAVVTGLSAHAWTEVYFRGFGWLTFDATPKTHASGSGDGGASSGESPSPDPAPTPTPPPEEPSPSAGSEEETPSPDPQEPEPSDAPTPEPSPAPSPEPSPDPSDADPDPAEADQDAPVSSPSFFPWPWLLLLLLVLAAVCRIVVTSPAFRARRAKTEDARLDVWAQEIFDLLQAENLVRRRDESPMAFCRRVDRLGLFSVTVGPVGECLSLIRYSAAVAQETDTRLLQDTAILLKNDLSRPARLRYLLRRVFVPLSRRDYARI